MFAATQTYTDFPRKKGWAATAPVCRTGKNPSVALHTDNATIRTSPAGDHSRTGQWNNKLSWNWWIRHNRCQTLWRKDKKITAFRFCTKASNPKSIELYGLSSFSQKQKGSRKPNRWIAEKRHRQLLPHYKRDTIQKCHFTRASSKMKKPPKIWSQNCKNSDSMMRKRTFGANHRQRHHFWYEIRTRASCNSWSSFLPTFRKCRKKDCQ